MYRMIHPHPVSPILLTKVFSVSELSSDTMSTKASFTCLFLLLFVPFGIAFPGGQLFARSGGNVCQSGLFGLAVLLLEDYSPAQQYCSQVFPVSCGDAHDKRSAPPLPTTAVTTTPVSTVPSTTASTTPASTTASTTASTAASSSQTTVSIDSHC